MIVDAHAHVWGPTWLPEPFYDGLARVGASLLGMDREMLKVAMLPMLMDETGEKLIESMNLAGVDATVIHPLDYGLGEGLGEPGLSYVEQNETY